MTDILSESRKLREIIEIICEDVIKQKTLDCFRVYKAKVIEAPNGSVCSVQLVGDETVLALPYSSKTANVTEGSMVWVAVVYGSFRNAIVWETYNFK